MYKRQIDENVVVEHSEVEHSILLAGAEVRGLDVRLEASLLGREVKLGRSEGMPRTMSMIVGDKSEIALP